MRLEGVVRLELEGQSFSWETASNSEQDLVVVLPSSEPVFGVGFECVRVQARRPVLVRALPRAKTALPRMKDPVLENPSCLAASQSLLVAGRLSSVATVRRGIQQDTPAAVLTKQENDVVRFGEQEWLRWSGKGFGEGPGFETE